jgi:hypothetical protein
MGIATINDGVECFQRIHLQNKGSPLYKLKLESQSESKQVLFCIHHTCILAFKKYQCTSMTYATTTGSLVPYH